MRRNPGNWLAGLGWPVVAIALVLCAESWGGLLLAGVVSLGYTAAYLAGWIDPE